MPRKKSARSSIHHFLKECDDVQDFLEACRNLAKKKYITWSYEQAVIKLYRDFEVLVLDLLVHAVNSDTSTISQTTNTKFPRHLSDEVCEYLIVGRGFFDFKGRDGLIKTVTECVPPSHWIVTKLKDSKYREALEQLCALRNFAAHRSRRSKLAALKACKAKRMGSAGSYLKANNRIKKLVDKLRSLANDMLTEARY